MPSIKTPAGHGENNDDHRGLKVVLKLNTKEMSKTPTSSRKAEKEKVELQVEEEIDEDEDEEEEIEENTSSSTSAMRKKRRKKKFRFSAIRPKRIKKSETDVEISIDAGDVSGKLDEDSNPIEVPAAPVAAKKTQQELTPFQLLLDQLLRLLERKDKEDHFKNPVTDEIAPGYSEIVPNPMDFSTIRHKIRSDQYQKLDDFKSDVLLVFNNAETYNQPGTVYHQSAKILQSFSFQLFSKEKLMSLSKVLPFIKQIPADLIGFHISGVGQHNRTCSLANRLTESINDDMLAAEILTKSRAAAKLAADKLAVRQPNSKIAFFRQHEDGSTTLNFMNDREDKGRKITLGELIGDLKEGTPGISLYTEDKRNIVVPVSPLDYGPFSSFAPRYDSTWATLTKDDSKLLLSTYGDQTAAQYAQSLQAYVKDSNDYLVNLVDNILDTLTNGSHSAAFCEKPVVSEAATDEIDFEALKSVSSLGIDTSFLDQIEGMLKRPPPPPHTEPPVTQHAVGNPDKLKATGQLLKELAATQAARVSRPPPFALTEVSNPSTQEVQLASQVVTNLQTLVPLAGPSAVSNVGTVRSLMGIERPKEILNDEPKKQEKSEGLDMDMDLLREFLHME